MRTILLEVIERTLSRRCAVWSKSSDTFTQRLRRAAAALLLSLFCGYAIAGPTTTTLAASPNPGNAGSTVTLTATVSGNSPTGTVTFFYAGGYLGDGTVTGGVATLSGLAPVIAGWYDLTAKYNGDAQNTTSTSAVLWLRLNPGTAPTVTTVAAAVNPVASGQSATVTARVDAAGASVGTVVFIVDGVESAWVPLNNAAASVSIPSLSTGSHTVVARYEGDAINASSTSTSLLLQVGSVGPAVPVSVAPVVNLEYDAQGNRTKTVEAQGVPGFGFATSTTYDRLERQFEVTDAQTGKITYAYNGREDVTQVTDPRLLVTQYQRDGLASVKKLVSTDTGDTTRTFDAAGNLKTSTDSRGVLATMTYDALNRMTGVVYTKAGLTTQSLTFAYDQAGVGFSNGIGRLTSTTHPTGSTKLAYDPQGRVLVDTQQVNATAGANASSITRTVTYGYDAAGRLSSILYPSGRKLTLSYGAGQLSSMSLAKDSTSAATYLVTQIDWEPFGAPRGWQWQNGATSVAHNFSYDTSGRLVRSRLGNLLRDISYDAADRITGYTHYNAATGAAAAANDQTFGYDAAGRLTSFSANGSSWSVGYDLSGNRNSLTLNGVARSYTTAATSNRLASVANPLRSFGYDNAGNTTSDTGLAYTSTYDATGRLAQVLKGGVTWNYAYDAQGRRVRKFSSSGATSTVIFAYDQEGHLLGEYSSSGAALREYVWMGDTPVAVFTPGALAADPPLVYYIHADHLNTPRAVLDTTGALRWTWYAEPFGTTAPNANPAAKGAFAFTLRFPGQVFDAESGTHYNLFRDYDSTVGRYTQSDPIGLTGGINTYAYVGGNPLSYSDPLGQKHKASSAHCKALRRKMDNLMNDLDDRWTDLEKGGLPERILPKGQGEPLRSTMRGHRTLINDRESNLRKWEKRYNDECEPDDKDDGGSCNECTAGAVAATMVGGYLVYRCVRMVPSLLPPLWWTIPANVAAP